MQFRCSSHIADNVDIIHAGSQRQTAKFDVIGPLGLGQPVLVFNPRVWRFLLQIVFKYLLEKSEMIVQADTVAV